VKSKETGGDSGSGYLLDHSAGSGPFSVDHWTEEQRGPPEGEPELRWHEAIAQRRPLQARSGADKPAVRAREGDIDIANDLGSEQITALQGKAGVTTVSADSLLLVYVGMNAQFKPLDNVKVREALRTGRRLRRHREEPPQGQR